jgi:HTH-type transcriptional regulator, transcriptional repressor of NAD biosynthesis genes
VSRGLVLGKFMPPHAGHVYLCELARRYVDELSIVVSTMETEPIPGELRHQWMRELFPFDRVVHLTDINPQDPSEHPEFWSIWKASLERVLPWRPDVVFASEAYGATLAKVLGARFVAVGRDLVATSGTAIREDPAGEWHHIPRCARPYFVKRVSILGPESTGKTTLARTLAREWGTVWVPEWARALLEQRALEGLDWNEIVRGQIASEEALARDANRVLVCDTDPLATTVWADFLHAKVTSVTRQYDLTLLTSPGVPWVADPVRYLPHGGDEFFARMEDALRLAGRPYVVLRGTFDERTDEARRAIASRFGRKPSVNGM